MTVKQLVYIMIGCAIFASACERPVHVANRLRPPIIADPYQKFFWGKNIKYMMKKNPFGGFDTTTFDDSGNIIKIQSGVKIMFQMEYDNHHLMTREWIGDDIGDYYIIEYDTNEFNNGFLIQRWIPIRSGKWDYKLEDIDPTASNYSVFVLDEENKVVKEIDYQNSILINYQYDNGNLKSIEKYNLIAKLKSYRKCYVYSNSQLKFIEEYSDDRKTPSKIHFFSNDRLDSTQSISTNNTVDYTDKYEFTYINR